MKIKHVHFELGDGIRITTRLGHDITVSYDGDGYFAVSDERACQDDPERLYMADEDAQVLRLDEKNGWHVCHKTGDEWVWTALSSIMRSLYASTQARAVLKDTL